MPGDPGLDQVADAIRLVAPGQVGELAPRGDHLDIGVDVAVGPLGRLDHGDRLVGGTPQGGIIAVAQLPAGRLEPLVDIAIEEGQVEADFEAERVVATRSARREPKVGEVARPFELLEAMGQRSLAVDPQPVRPEPTGHRRAVEIERREAGGQARIGAVREAGRASHAGRLQIAK